MPQYHCMQCQAPFYAQPGRRKRGEALYCSRRCVQDAYQTPHLIAVRFWSHVTQTETCWLWHGKRFRNGYGCFITRKEGTRRYLLAHRFAYALHYGAIPDDLLVLHNCPDGDNPACVNPPCSRAGGSCQSFTVLP